MPNHVAKNMDANAKLLEAKGAKAKSLESNSKGSKEAKEAKGWVGLPID
jgi:hypothetical protein